MDNKDRLITELRREILIKNIALEKAREDINWMLNNRKFLNPECFDYLDDKELIK